MKHRDEDQLALFGEITRSPEPKDVAGTRATTLVNTVLQAGAGTGKTTAIVCRVLDVILSEPELDPSTIVLITFTEKAAAEIADRVREALVSLEMGFAQGDPAWRNGDGKVIWSAPDDRIDDYRRACGIQLLRIEHLRSQTIHSFCQNLLRLFPIEANLDPQFEVIQGFELSRFHDEAFRSWIESDSSEPGHLVEWELLHAHFRTIQRIQDQVLSLIGRRDLISNEAFSLGEITDADAELRRWVRAAREIEQGKIDKLTHEPNREVLEYLRENEPPPDGTFDAWVDWFRPIARSLDDSVLNKGTQDTKEVIRALRSEKTFRRKHLTVFELLGQHHTSRALRGTAKRFFAHFEAMKRERGLIDFDDLLFRTRDLLRNQSILSRVRRGIRCIFVDEFQDTDRVQAEIVRRLATDDEGRLMESRLVIVGDPKQSIYSFRRADPEMYATTVDDLVELGAKEEYLEKQYRSDAILLENLNAMFSTLFGEVTRETEGLDHESRAALRSGHPWVFQPLYKRLEPARGELLPPDKPRLHLLYAEVEGEPSVETAQAKALAQWLDQARARGESLGRFAILLRKMTKLHDYLDVFDSWGIPYELPPSRSYLDRPAAVDLVAVLRAIAFPFDRGAEVSAARTPYFALTDNEIVAHQLGIDHDEPCGYSHYIGEISYYRDLARSTTVADLVERLIRDCDVAMYYSALKGGDLYVGHLDRLRDLAIQWDQTTGRSLRAFVDEMTRRRDSWDDFDIAMDEEPADSVRILTVHAAKGLEFDVVILPDLSALLGGGSLSVNVVDPADRIIFTSGLYSLSSRYPKYEDRTLEEIVGLREEAEEERLFYVAVTRAKSEVVFVHHSKIGDRSFARSLNTSLGITKKSIESDFPKPGEAPKVKDLPLRGTLVKVALHNPGLVSGPGAGSHRFVHDSIDEVARGPLSPLVPVARDEKVSSLQRSEVLARRAGLRNREAGLLLHRALEIWDGGRDSLDAALSAAAEEAGVDDEVCRRVATRISRLGGSRTLERITRATTLGRETTIYYLDDEGRAVTGRIDRLIEDDGQLVVVDYKTGERTPARAERDDEQIRRYSRAIEEMTGRRCHGWLWYLDLDRDEMVEVSNERRATSDEQ